MAPAKWHRMTKEVKGADASQLAAYYSSLLEAVLQWLFVAKNITEHPGIYFGILHRIDVLDAMLVLVL